MNQWFQRLSFLWEETAPPGGAPRRYQQAPAGIPRPLMKAARFVLIAVASTSLMGQVIGVRLVAPVDAQSSYRAKCIQECNKKFEDCRKGCAKLGEERAENCRETCQERRESCISSCNREDDGGGD